MPEMPNSRIFLPLFFPNKQIVRLFSLSSKTNASLIFLFSSTSLFFFLCGANALNTLIEAGCLYYRSFLGLSVAFNWHRVLLADKLIIICRNPCFFLFCFLLFLSFLFLNYAEDERIHTRLSMRIREMQYEVKHSTCEHRYVYICEFLCVHVCI